MPEEQCTVHLYVTMSHEDYALLSHLATRSDLTLIQITELLLAALVLWHTEGIPLGDGFEDLFYQHAVFPVPPTEPLQGDHPCQRKSDARTSTSL